MLPAYISLSILLISTSTVYGNQRINETSSQSIIEMVGSFKCNGEAQKVFTVSTGYTLIITEWAMSGGTDATNTRVEILRKKEYPTMLLFLEGRKRISQSYVTGIKFEGKEKVFLRCFSKDNKDSFFYEIRGLLKHPK